MHLILTGATGLVGSGCLEVMLTNKAITKVSILSRRPVPMTKGHSKANVILHKDFNEYPQQVMQQLEGATGCVWALGISVTDVSKEAYEDITFTYTVAAAKAFSSLSDPFKFVYVSGEGATTTPSSFTPRFASVKGRAEAALLDLSTQPQYSALRPYSLRPASVDPKFHKEIHPHIPGYKGSKAFLYPPLLATMRVASSNWISPTRDLGRVLTELAMGDGELLTGKGISGEGRTISNVGMRRLAGI